MKIVDNAHCFREQFVLAEKEEEKEKHASKHRYMDGEKRLKFIDSLRFDVKIQWIPSSKNPNDLEPLDLASKLWFCHVYVKFNGISRATISLLSSRRDYFVSITIHADAFEWLCFAFSIELLVLFFESISRITDFVCLNIRLNRNASSSSTTWLGSIDAKCVGIHNWIVC